MQLSSCGVFLSIKMSRVMRCLAILGVVAALVLPAGAAKRVTAAQLEQSVVAASAAHKRDAEIAHLISDSELTERLSDAAIERLSALVVPGSQAGDAFTLLADKSAFLYPPASEADSAAAPDAPAQQQMLAAARSYVAQILPRLPNFLATRVINRNDDSPQTLKPGAWPVRAGLHRVDVSYHDVSVRDERENQPPAQGSAVWKEQTGLVSGGEFGSTLGMILADTTQGQVTWSHWEQGDTAREAVYTYSVPRSASHFEIIGSLKRQANIEASATSMGGPKGVQSISAKPSIHSSNTSIVRAKPGYHGSLWIDPATGTILRITIEADPKDSAIFKRAEILVQYGPVQIGDSNFICPVRSLAYSVAETSSHPSSEDAPTEWLNETLFTGYHRFASNTEILPEPEQPK